MTDTTNRSLSATSLVGDGVKNRGGDSLGEVKDLMIDLNSGTISYVVVEMGGFLGIGSKLFAVPWDAVAIDGSDHTFVIDLDRDRLEHAPGFDPDDWPDMSNDAWNDEVRTYYADDPDTIPG